MRAVLLAFGVLGCAQPPDGGLGEPDGAAPDVRVVVPERTTTSGAIAIANLDALIEGHERALSRPGGKRFRAALVDLRLQRSQFLGTYIEDLGRAETLAEDAVTTDPGAASLVLRARVHGAVHRFAEARADLYAAAAVGADVGEGLLELDLATGRNLDAVLAHRRERAADHPTTTTLAELAAAESAVGHWKEADEAFLASLEQYRDVSPFVVAWTSFQRGVSWSEHAGLPALADGLYTDATRRLPAYVVANVHLAEREAAVGDVDRAIQRLGAIDPDATSDGEPWAVRAKLAEQSGGDGSADAAIALERYEVLLARWPLAFADHAAEFFLAAGADPARALELARANLVNRPTDRAFALAIRAAWEAGDVAHACTWRAEAGDARPSMPLQQVRASLAESCR